MTERRRPRPERPPRTGGDAVAGRGRGLPVDWVMPGAEPEDEARPPDEGPPPHEPEPRREGEPPPDDAFAGFEDLGAGPPPGSGPGNGGSGDGGDRTGDGPPPRPDAAQLLALLDGLRGAVPRELQEQLTTLLREFLLALRALIDWYLERLDQPRREPEVEDIPID